jgi:hypothetical protein
MWVGVNCDQKQIPTRILAAARLRMARNDKVVEVEEIRARFPSPAAQGFGMTRRRVAHSGRFLA